MSHASNPAARCAASSRIAALVFLVVSLLAAPGPAAANEAQAAIPAAVDSLVGTIAYHTAREEDTFVDLARAHGLGFVELVAANRDVDVWLPEPGTRIVLPKANLLPDAPRRGIVINLPELRLYHFPGEGQPVESYPLGVGRDGWLTPTGSTEIVRKVVGPTWFPTERTRADRPDLPKSVPPGPDNPLGTHALYLGWPAYLIHGTNRPYGVGRRVSRGCIRMYPEDVVKLYAKVPIGTPVTVVDQPVKIGWHQNELYLEVHPTLAQVDQLEFDHRFEPEPIDDLWRRLREVAGEAADRIEWSAALSAARERSGVPIRVTR